MISKDTAVICSAVFPEFLWLATGGLGQFNDRVKVLLGRQVIAFPDFGACDRWRKKAKDYPLLDITVSDYLEKNAPRSSGRWAPIWRIWWWRRGEMIGRQ